MPNSTADIQSLNQSLIAAAQAGQVEKVKEFLAQGANVNAKDADDCSALMYAAINDDTDLLELLLKTEGIDVNAKDNIGWTALIYAADLDSLNALGQLLNDSRVNILAKSNKGFDAQGFADASENTIALEMIQEKLKSNGSENFSAPEINSDGNHSLPTPELIGVVDPILVSL